MRILALAAALLLLIGGLFGLQSCQSKHRHQSSVALTPAQLATIVGLPNGATLSVPPNSVSAKIAAYLASNDQAPRRFEPGDREFTRWSGDPTPASQGRLVALTQLLKAYPDVTVQILGYTDNDGSPAANQQLSTQRAEGVMNRLVANGIDPRRLTAIGKGLADPIADNATDAGRARNRRIVLILTRNPSSQD